MSAIAARRRALLLSPPYNPLTKVTWRQAVWADDPLWTPPANGAAVSSWRNAGTVGGNLTQGVSGARPIFRSSVTALSGKAALDFDGVNDALGIGDLTVRNQSFTVIWIGRLDDTPALDERLVDVRGDVGGADYTSLLANSGNSGKFGLHSRGYGHSTVNSTSGLAAAVRGYFNGGSSAITVNGTATNFSLNVSAVASRFDLGAYWSTASSAWIGFSNNHTAFAALYAGNIMADAEWTNFKAWVSSYYALTLT